MDHDFWRFGCFVFVAIWFALLFALSARLKQDHEDAYRSIGMPALMGNAMAGTCRLIIFLYSARFRRLEDAVVNTISIVMAAWVPITLFWMFGPIMGLFTPK